MRDFNNTYEDVTRLSYRYLYILNCIEYLIHMYVANKSYFTETVLQCADLPLAQTPVLQAAAAGGQVVLRVVELNADSFSLRSCPGPRTRPLRSSSVQTVIQVRL